MEKVCVCERERECAEISVSPHSPEREGRTEGEREGERGTCVFEREGYLAGFRDSLCVWGGSQSVVPAGDGTVCNEKHDGRESDTET